MIFSRRRGGAGRHAKAEEPRRVEDVGAARQAALLDEEHVPGGPVADAEDQSGTGSHVADGGYGPYDFAEAPDAPRLDLGSLLLPAVDDVEIRVQAGENGVIQQVALVYGENALQLGVFAAPRSEGIWDEVRAEIRESLSADGVPAEETAGRWGVELRARLRTPEGLSDLRFIGIDGPRWMIRAVFQGPAAVDPSLAGRLNDCLTGLVVRRDDEARPVREPLPLRLPEQMAQAAQQSDEAEPAGGGSVSGSATGTGAGDVPQRRPSPRPRRDG